ncbi:MAG: cytochrome c-type biogenesis protein [bacterium JZ-2024 1]
MKGFREGLSPFHGVKKLLWVSLFLLAVVEPQSVYRKLFCPCGCRMNLAECNCEDAAVGLKKEISQWISEGKSEDEIVEILVERYGNTILAVPPKTFFGTFSYIFPYLLLALGSVAVFRFLSALSRVPSEEKAVSAESTREEEEILEEIRKDL